MSSLSSILQQARASLANPSRPQTPRVDARHMVNPLRMGNDMDSTNKSTEFERPSTAYGWNDAMSTSSNFSSFEDSIIESDETIDVLPVHDSISIHEKRQIRERLSRKGSRLGIREFKDEDTAEDSDKNIKPVLELKNSSIVSDHTISGKRKLSTDSLSSNDSQTSTGSDSQVSKEIVLKEKISNAIANYQYKKLDHYLEHSFNMKLESQAKEWISSSIKTLLKTHQSGLNQDKKLLLLLSVIIKNYENILDRSSIFGFYRIMYKISKDSSLDNYFKSLNLIDPIMRLGRKLCESVRGKKDWELLLYCIAILKNISYDSQENKDYLTENNTLGLLHTVLENAVRHLATEKQDQEKAIQLLVQVTACLRNIVNTENDFLAVSKSTILQLLCPLAKNLINHHELTLNICRIFSKVSLQEDCQKIMNDQCKNFYRIMLSVLNQYQDSISVIIRICFILGNLTFDNENERSEFSLQNDVPLLLNLLQQYDGKDISVSKKISELPLDANEKEKSKLLKEKRDIEDLLTKLIRLIANISIDKERGSYLTHSMQTKYLIHILERKSVIESEELVLNVVRCITNLTYYENEFRSQNSNLLLPEGTIFKHKFKLCELLSPLLLHDHPDAVLESARSFGNLSQDSSVQAWMRQRRLDEVMLILIDHDNFELVSAVCGVLINLTTLDTNFFTSINLTRLLEVLDYANEELAILIFKLLHNLVVNTPPGLHEHMDELYNSVDNIIEGILENESLTEEEEILISIGKKLLNEIEYENLPEE